MATLRVSIVNAINELHPLLSANIPDSEKNQIREDAGKLYKLLESVIQASLDAQAPEFELAISALESATESAQTARQDMQKTADTIAKTAKAISQIENVLKVAIAMA